MAALAAARDSEAEALWEEIEKEQNPHTRACLLQWLAQLRHLGL